MTKLHTIAAIGAALTLTATPASALRATWFASNDGNVLTAPEIPGLPQITNDCDNSLSIIFETNGRTVAETAPTVESCHDAFENTIRRRVKTRDLFRLQ